MPAWPSDRRDDEVWAMVAFLRRLPGMDAPAYRRLVHGEDGGGRAGAPLGDPALSALSGRAQRIIADSCARCHGLAGLGRGVGASPLLAGQGRDYLYASLRAYAAGQRHSGTMQTVAAELSEEDMRELARYYAGQPAPMPSPPGPEVAQAIERGRILSTGDQRVPACVACHGPGAHPRNPTYPSLSGQQAGYLVLQLGLFQRDQRGGTAYARIMGHVAGRLDAAQVRDVALYYASLRPASP